jgi:hypothetical protein
VEAFKEPMTFLDFGPQLVILARLLDFTVEAGGQESPFVPMTIRIAFPREQHMDRHLGLAPTIKAFDPAIFPRLEHLGGIGGRTFGVQGRLPFGLPARNHLGSKGDGGGGGATGGAKVCQWAFWPSAQASAQMSIFFFIGIKTSISHSFLHRVMFGPSIKPRSRMSRFMTPLPTAWTKLATN